MFVIKCEYCRMFVLKSEYSRMYVIKSEYCRMYLVKSEYCSGLYGNARVLKKKRWLVWVFAFYPYRVVFSSDLGLHKEDPYLSFIYSLVFHRFSSDLLMTLTTVIKPFLPNFLGRAIVVLNFVRRFRNFIADTVPC